MLTTDSIWRCFLIVISSTAHCPYGHSISNKYLVSRWRKNISWIFIGVCSWNVERVFRITNDIPETWKRAFSVDWKQLLRTPRYEYNGQLNRLFGGKNVPRCPITTLESVYVRIHRASGCVDDNECFAPSTHGATTLRSRRLSLPNATCWCSPSPLETIIENKCASAIPHYIDYLQTIQYSM